MVSHGGHKAAIGKQRVNCRAWDKAESVPQQSRGYQQLLEKLRESMGRAGPRTTGCSGGRAGWGDAETVKDQGPGMLRWHPCGFGERRAASSMVGCVSLDSLHSTPSLLRQAEGSCDKRQSMKILKSSPGWCCSPDLHRCSSAVQHRPATVPCASLCSPPPSLPPLSPHAESHVPAITQKILPEAEAN